jgi:hypothetical protein
MFAPAVGLAGNGCSQSDRREESVRPPPSARALSDRKSWPVRPPPSVPVETAVAALSNLSPVQSVAELSLVAGLTDLLLYINWNHFLSSTA